VKILRDQSLFTFTIENCTNTLKIFVTNRQEVGWAHIQLRWREPFQVRKFKPSAYAGRKLMLNPIEEIDEQIDDYLIV
jgi:hypothetical protein